MCLVSIVVALATTGCTDTKDQPIDQRTSAATDSPSTASSDGGAIEIGTSGYSVTNVTAPESGSGESATVSFAAFFENTSKVDVATGSIEVAWFDSGGNTIAEYATEFDSTGIIHTGTVLPGETGAVASIIVLAEEPSDVLLTVHDVAWEPYSDELHGQCEISNLNVRHGNNQTEFSFVIESSHPYTLKSMRPTIVLFEDDDLVGGIAPIHTDQYVRDVEPGVQHASFVIDSTWISNDIDQMVTEAYCVEPQN